MEGYPAFQRLKYAVSSLSACARLDGKELHENVAAAYTSIPYFVINNNAGCLGKKITKDLNFELG